MVGSWDGDCVSDLLFQSDNHLEEMKEREAVREKERTWERL